jgi:ankyrin repeat protein
VAELQAFFNAVLNGDDATVGAWLAESPAVAQMKFDGATALHCAALENRR